MKQFDKKYLVITGGAGFIGSCTVRYLNDLGVKNLIIVDDFDSGCKWQNLVGKSFVDIISRYNLFDWLEGRESEIEAFIHLGACSSTVEQDADYLLENNYRFSVKLAEFALSHGHRFIYASSASTYGDGQLGFSDAHDGLEQLRPMNMYGYSKHLFDLWAKRQGVLNQVVGLKYFNVYGPNEFHKGRMASTITHILPMAQKEGLIRLFKSSEPRLFADGEQKRDFIYVKDAVRMTCDFLENGAGGIYNIGTGKAGSWNSMAQGVFRGIGKPVNVQYIDMPVDLQGKYQNYTCADMKKTWEALGESVPCRAVEEGVVEYVRDYLIPGARF